MSRKKRNSFKTLVITVFFLSLCLLTLAFLWGADQVNRQVQDIYGPINPTMDPVQKVKYITRMYFQGSELINFRTNISNEYLFEISLGDSVSKISNELEQVGLISNAELFRDYLIYRGFDRKIQAGLFAIQPGMNQIMIAEKLIDPLPDKIQFVVLAGWRAEEIASALPLSGLPVSPKEFLSTVRNPVAILLPDPLSKLNSLEGYLAPGTYLFDRTVSNDEFVQALLNRFVENLPGDFLDAFNYQGLSLHEAVILASIVEREAIVDDEMPMIASVFFNRYRIGMKLDSDPTVQYAIGYNADQQTWWTNPLSLKDLQIDSAYNTYIYAGLPPTPIANPSLEALQAVAYPADTPYYYFRARCDGSGKHEFAISFEEHLNNACP